MNIKQILLFNRSRPDFDRIYVFGAGGSGRETAWLISQIWDGAVEVVFVVDDPGYLKDLVNGFPVVLMPEIEGPLHSRYIVALGDSAKRKAISEKFDTAGHKAAILLHPRIEASPWVDVDTGSIVCANSTITCNVIIGKHVQINVGSSISHDVTVGDYTTISPRVTVCGNVRIGRGVFIGANSCIINGRPETPLLIGDGAVIAASACVTTNVSPGALVAGVPAIEKRTG